MKDLSCLNDEYKGENAGGSVKTGTPVFAKGKRKRIMVTTIYINEKQANEFLKIREMSKQTREENGYQAGFSFTEKEEVGFCLTAEFTAVVPVEGEPYGEIALFEEEKKMVSISFLILDEIENDFAIQYKEENYYILIRILREFTDEESAKEYALENLGKNEFQKAKIGEDTVVLCGTCIPYEDEFYPFAENMLQKFDFPSLDASSLRDEFIVIFEKYCNTRFIEGCDEF